jgi:serine protease Do
MRRILAAIGMLFLTAVPARADGPIVELIAAVKPSVVAIGTHDDTSRPPDVILGTGFAVGDGGHILTALHVVRGAPAGSLSIYVGQGDDAEIFPVKQVAADPDNDMALLKIEGKTLPALRLFLGKPLSEGEEVAFTGYPVGAVYGLYPATHRGIVSAVTPIARAQVKPGDLTPDMIKAIDKKIMAYQLDATSFPGNSGGPLVDPADGAVVGVIDSTYVQETKDSAADRPSGITFAMPIPPAIEMLKKAGLEP